MAKAVMRVLETGMMVIMLRVEGEGMKKVERGREEEEEEEEEGFVVY